MKKHHLIFASSVMFTILFYDQNLGLNLALFGLLLISLLVYNYRESLNSLTTKALLITSILSCLAFAWYGDFPSFLALSLSLLSLQYKTQHAKLKIIQVFLVIIVNSFASLGRILMFSQWLPKQEVQGDFAKKLVAFVLIPLLFIGLFFGVYAFGSDLFSSVFSDYTLDVNVFQLIVIAVLGLYVSFSFWNFWVPDFCISFNSQLENEFESNSCDKSDTSLSWLDFDFQRKSGEITFVLLNTLLLFFIVTYNYEQFFEIQNRAQLSTATHERVNAVIISVLMAVGLILLYFRARFTFDETTNRLKILAKIWMVLNAVLVLSAALKNMEYVHQFGLTYKRLGVFAFLILVFISLLHTWLKISLQKTNAYLFNHMVWYVYGVLLLCSFVNWGQLITSYNLAVNKGVDPVFISRLEFNDSSRRDYLQENQLDGQQPEMYREDEIKEYQEQSFLSKVLYYETLQSN